MPKPAPSSSRSTIAALGFLGFLATAPAAAHSFDGADNAAPDAAYKAAASAYAVEAAADDSAAEPQRDIIVTGARHDDEVLKDNPKSTAPILDTPQSVTVISAQRIRDENLLTLRDALTTVPGITFGAGEGGGGYGDSINLRGYSANNDITIDGIRDSAQYSRTDPFNLQQIEVYNGANSASSGSGSVGGSINLVSKQAGRGDLTIAQAGIGTDNYYRASIDSNQQLNNLVAVRLNGFYHRNDVPGRDVEKYKRWGVAPSIKIGVEGPTSLILSYVHQQDRNTPVYGVPYYKSLVNDGPLADVDPSDYYGIANLDKQKINVDRLTATFSHQFSEGLSVRNLTRWQRVAQYSVTSAPQGTFCLSATGLQPVGADGKATTGTACRTTINNVVDSTGVFRNSITIDVAPGYFQPNGPRGLVRDQVNDLIVNQTDLRLVSGQKGGLHNILVIGAALTWEDYSITSASLIRNSLGQAMLLPQINMANPDTVYTGPINFTVTGRSRSHTMNKAIYAFDTLEINDMFELSGAVRYENNRGTFRAVPYPGSPATPATYAAQTSDENLFSWRLGAVFKPTAATALYASIANAKTPTSATVRLGCGLPANSAAADPCDVKPETARNIEIGAKAELMDGALFATIAAFRNERTNFRLPSNDPDLPGLQVLDGRSRVDGVSLGLSGNITPAWKFFGNYTYLKSKVLQSVSDYDLEHGVIDYQRGSELVQIPKHAASLYTSYTLPIGLEIGYGLTYQGSYATHSPNAKQPRQFRVPDYLIHRAFLSYKLMDGLTAQLNVQNVTDETYYTNVRNNANASTGAITGGWATPGEGRSAVLSLFYSF